jgi:2-polyprenyl-6-methoxyphenol hydroxylase-like FAD-dependent oxidoreductase
METKETKNSQIPVLIIGAGPTGLVLALALTKLGIKIRIIDKELVPGTTSRAIIVHARTLEFYQQLGIAQKVIDNGLQFSAANIWVNGKKKAHIALGEMGIGLSPFPFMTIYPQDEHEVMLIEELEKLGVTVERGIEFELLDQTVEDVVATLKHKDGSEEICHAHYLAGCDGAHSAVRKFFRMDFQGSTYQRLFYVADVYAEGSISDKELHVAVDDEDFVGIFPLKQKNLARLTGVLKSDDFGKNHQFTWDDVKEKALSQLDLDVKSVQWFSAYHVHHRLAEHFRVGHVFLLGDAAHIHSPVGGQGMNTGVGDAMNLAWKLAGVLKEELDIKVLNSYEVERKAYAKSLVATTDRAFTIMSSSGPIARFVRMNIIPPLLALLSHFNFARRFAFKRLSQIAIDYRMSFLSKGKSAEIEAGDRMPWVENLGWPHPMRWNIQVFGKVHNNLKRYCDKSHIRLEHYPWNNKFQQKGIKKNFIYLIRPDGYIGLIDPKGKPENIQKYFSMI